MGCFVNQSHETPALAWCERGAGVLENLPPKCPGDALEHLRERADVDLFHVECGEDV